MKHKILITLFSLILMLSFGSVERVLACSCSVGEICSNYNFASLVFIGKIVEVKGNTFKNLNPQKRNYVSGEVTFEVEEGFVGAKKGDRLKTISATTTSGCGYVFETGKAYLIFGFSLPNSQKAKLGENGFWTTICSRTSEIKYASDGLEFIQNPPLEFLRKLSPKNVSGRIFGKVYRTEWSKNNNLLEIPFANISVRIRETKSHLLDKILKTNAKGEFALEVPVGVYQVTAKLPKGFQIDGGDDNRPFAIRKNGCADSSFELEEIKKK